MAVSALLVFGAAQHPSASDVLVIMQEWKKEAHSFLMLPKEEKRSAASTDAKSSSELHPWSCTLFNQSVNQPIHTNQSVNEQITIFCGSLMTSNDQFHVLDYASASIRRFLANETF